MAWDRNLRIAAWACFFLMWLSLALFIFHDTSKAPEDADMIFIFAFLALLAAFFILLVFSSLAPLVMEWHESRIVRKQGMLVPAVVKDVTDTGISINKQPVLAITLTVRPPYEEAFETTLKKIIPFSSIPQVQPGAQLQVYYIFGTKRVALPE